MPKKFLPTPLKANLKRQAPCREARRKVEKYFVQVQMEQGWQRDDRGKAAGISYISG